MNDLKGLLEEIRNQNSMILARLSRLEDQAVLVPGEQEDLSFNLSAMERADDPLEFIQNHNARVKASGRLRARK